MLRMIRDCLLETVPGFLYCSAMLCYSTSRACGRKILLAPKVGNNYAPRDLQSKMPCGNASPRNAHTLRQLVPRSSWYAPNTEETCYIKSRLQWSYISALLGLLCYCGTRPRYAHLFYRTNLFYQYTLPRMKSP